MRQIPLEISVATDGSLLPSKNLLQIAKIITGILIRKENGRGSSEVGFFLPDADMFGDLNDECAHLG